MHLLPMKYASNTAYDELLDKNAAARLLPGIYSTISFPERGRADARVRGGCHIMAMGITFTIYSESGNIDRAGLSIPFPVMARQEWERIQAGSSKD